MLANAVSRKGLHMSEKQIFSLGAVLNILLTNTNCRSSYFANHYVYKDASLVSKWLHNAQFPTPDVFPLVVRFTLEQSNAATRSIMRIEIDRLVYQAGLDDATNQALADITDFDGYLLGVLNVLSNLKKAAITDGRRFEPIILEGV